MTTQNTHAAPGLAAPYTAGPVPLYYHETGGGAKYLTDKFTLCPDGTKEGIFEGASFVVRIDGDAELTVSDDLLCAAPDLLAALERLANAVTAHRQAITIRALDELCDAEDNARDQIAKAKGTP